jgi:hypothetical protein
METRLPLAFLSSIVMLSKTHTQTGRTHIPICIRRDGRGYTHVHFDLSMSHSFAPRRRRTTDRRHGSNYFFWFSHRLS